MDTTKLDSNMDEQKDQTVEQEKEKETINQIDTWDELDIDPNILRGIYAYGYERPSPIQRKAILPMLKKRDLIAQAQSGTGKTATFAIGALARVDLKENKNQVLILSPTRELTTQTANVVKNLGSLMDGLRVETLFGGGNQAGASTNLTVDSWRKNETETKDTKEKRKERVYSHILCGCPGKVYDMMRTNRITTRSIRLIILDEADEVLSSGFKEQVYNIFQHLSNDVNIALFSATLPNYVFTITNKIMRNPVQICVKAEQLTLEGIAQYFVAVENDMQKFEILKDIYSYISLSQCMIYCNSVRRVNDLYNAMLEEGFPVCCIHSNMDKKTRDESFADFRTGKYRVMISSNVTSRGIDIQQVSTVINYDIPKCVHNYLHRIGRSGRWGRKGFAINFVTKQDVFDMNAIEKRSLKKFIFS
jgi:superfamily II DNA/RNA helicase